MAAHLAREALAGNPAPRGTRRPPVDSASACSGAVPVMHCDVTTT